MTDRNDDLHPVLEPRSTSPLDLPPAEDAEEDADSAEAEEFALTWAKEVQDKVAGLRFALRYAEGALDDIKTAASALAECLEELESTDEVSEGNATCEEKLSEVSLDRSGREGLFSGLDAVVEAYNEVGEALGTLDTAIRNLD